MFSAGGHCAGSPPRFPHSQWTRPCGFEGPTWIGCVVFENTSPPFWSCLGNTAGRQCLTAAMLPRCASSHATTADRLPRPVRDLSRWVHCRRVENRHDVSVVEHDDHPQVRRLRLDAGCCPHFTVRPMHPYAAGSCSSTASTTRSINPEQLGTEKSSVAAQRAAALDPVNTAARAPVSSAYRRSSWVRKADSHLAHRCLPVLPDREGTSLGCGTLVSSGPGSFCEPVSVGHTACDAACPGGVL